MKHKTDPKWIEKENARIKSDHVALEDADRYRDQRTPNGADDQRRADERREHLLRIRLLEERIAGTHASTKQREQSLTDERERIVAGAIVDVDHEHNDRVESILEKYHGAVTRFFMVGTGALFAFCGFWIALFVAVILIGMVAALLGFPL